MKRVWLIEGLDPAGTLVWRQEVPFGRYSERRMKEVLRLLAARAELGFDEIFQAVAAGAEGLDSALDVRKSLQSIVLRCGTDWAFSARMMHKDKDGTLHAPRPAHL